MKQTRIIFLFVLTFTAGMLPVETVISKQGYGKLFNEICEIVEKNFYDPQQVSGKFIHIKQRYTRDILKAADRQEFVKLVNSMLGELNTSHTYYLTPDDYEYYHLGALFAKIPEISRLFHGKEIMYPTVGIITRTISAQVFIASVLPGSAAAHAGLLQGDEIISINGKPYEPVRSLKSYVGKRVTFRIKRLKNEKSRQIDLTPLLVNPKKEMLDAQKASIRIIPYHNTKIGYIHIYSYAGEEYHKLLRETLTWGPLKNADALIIDLRYGLGGAWTSYLNIFNRNVPVMTMKDRNGKKTIIDSQWRKPAVYLVNNYSRSGKELLVYGAKKYRLATVIGERTPGSTRGGRLFPLSNGDMLFLAVQSCTIDGADLEGVGVEPDIRVPFDIRYCNGTDPQVDRAVEYLFTRLTKK